MGKLSGSERAYQLPSQKALLRMVTRGIKNSDLRLVCVTGGIDIDLKRTEDVKFFSKTNVLNMNKSLRLLI
jgi:hypothetical protein